MPGLLRMELSPEQQAELRRRLHERDLAPHTRMRLECVRLSGKGMTVPQVAALGEVHPATVRAALKRFAAGGCEALVDTPRCGRPPRLQRADLAAVKTSGQLSREDLKRMSAEEIEAARERGQLAQLLGEGASRSA